MIFWNVTRFIFGGRAQRDFCAAVVLFLLFLGLIAALWSTLRETISEGEDYQVKIEDFKIWAPAPWLPDNFVSEALEYLPSEARKKTMNRLDKTLVDNLIVAFASHPLVARVDSIVVGFPEIEVRLRYRQPVANVDTSTRTTRLFLDHAFALFEGDETLKLLRDPTKPSLIERTARQESRYVVDATGRRLPDTYFERSHAVLKGMPTIFGIETTPVGTSTKPVVSYGPCGDPRLANAARFVEFLNDADALSLFGIDAVFALHPIGDNKDVYFLYTNTKATIKWGRFDLPPDDAKDQEYYKKNAEVYEEETRVKLFEYQRQKVDALKKELEDRTLEELDGLDLSDVGSPPTLQQSSGQRRAKK